MSLFLWRYLRIPAWNLDKKQQTAAITACLREHPEYILYVLCKEDVAYLKEILALPDGPVPGPPFWGTVHRMAALGLVDVTVEKNGKTEQGILSLAADAAALAELLTEFLCKKTYRMLKETDDGIRCYILAYGLIGMDSLYERYTKNFKKRVGKEDFLRIVYWYGNFSHSLQTAYRTDGTSYAASRQLNMEAEKFTKAKAYARTLRRMWPQDLSVQMRDQSLTEQSRKSRSNP